MKRLLVCLAVLASTSIAQPANSADDPLAKLASDFWKWRATNAPFSGDDVNRIERPGGLREWSRASIDRRRKELDAFDARWKQLATAGAPAAKQVDYRLIGSALARVHWELERNPRWRRDPNFYIDQTLTALAEALTVPAPYDETRSREIVTRIQNMPAILQQGEANLDQMPAPFVTVAIQSLDGIRDRLRNMATALRPQTTLSGEQLNGATEAAATAL